MCYWGIIAHYISVQASVDHVVMSCLIITFANIMVKDLCSIEICQEIRNYIIVGQHYGTLPSMTHAVIICMFVYDRFIHNGNDFYILL